VDVLGNGSAGSRFVVHGVREPEFLPQGVVLLRDDQQRNGLPEEMAGQVFGFTRPALDQGAVLYILELPQDVGAEGCDVAGDPWPERCDRCPVNAAELARRPDPLCEWLQRRPVGGNGTESLGLGKAGQLVDPAFDSFEGGRDFFDRRPQRQLASCCLKGSGLARDRG
jgi:hypothetical protein